MNWHTIGTYLYETRYNFRVVYDSVDTSSNSPGTGSKHVLNVRGEGGADWFQLQIWGIPIFERHACRFNFKAAVLIDEKTSSLMVLTRESFKLSRGEAGLVIERLGMLCSVQDELGTNEISALFEEEEPSSRYAKDD